MTPIQLIGLLAQIALEALKLYRVEAVKAGRKLTPAERKAINESIVKAVATKDTTELEAALGAPAEEK